MINEIKLLTKVQMCNFFGINEARHSRDSKKRNKMYTAAIGILCFAAILCLSVGGNTYLLISFGMSEVVPSLVASTITGYSFILTLFRAGPTLFNIKSFEKTVCLPIRVESIVISRFLNLYLYNMLFNIFIMASAVAVTAYCGDSNIIFYPTMILGAFTVPLLPITLSVFLGTIGYYFASKVKRKNLMSILWYFGVFAAIFLISFSNTELPNEELAGQLSEQMATAGRYYPLLDWFSDGVNGDILKYILFTAISTVSTLVLLVIIAKSYKKICIGLSSTSAKRNYKMKKQASRSVITALYIREIKRYFSSAIYVMNTIIGFIIAVVLSFMILFLGIESLCEEIGIPYWMLTRVLPVVIGVICNIMPTTASAISMEGKNFWLIQSLPISMKNIITAKVLVNLTFAVPSCIISSTFLAISLKADPLDMIFIYIIPLILVIFGSLVGLYMNISNPMMDWESEAVPVKQSRSSVMTMFILFLVEIAAMIVYFMTPNSTVTIVNIAVTSVFALGSIFVYIKASRTDIRTIK